MKRMNRKAALLLVILVGTLGGALSGNQSFAEEVSVQGGGPIVNGVLSEEEPSVGMLLFSPTGDAASASMICTGTLIGCHTFLTAAHCVCDTLGIFCQGANAPDPSVHFVYLPHAGVFNVQHVAVRSDFDFPVGDVAVVRLASDVTGVRPARINDAMSPPSGTAGRIVGFGRAGGRDQNYGIKRAGDVVTTTCSGGISNTTSVCWSFMPPLGAPGTNSNTCNGDSGGPLFVDFGAGRVVAGITSGGTSDGCSLGDFSYDANVYNYRSWIQTEAAGDLGVSTCGSLANVGQSGASSATYHGLLARDEPLVYDFDVPPGIAELRVILNSVNDFDLYVRQGPGVSETNADCSDTGPRAIGVCRFSNPTAGQWSALVKPFSTSGMYQLTITQLAWRCDDPANEGKACNDGNDCTTGDVCQSGSCVGSALPDGTACSDGNPCTNPDQCISGACVGGSQPRAGCKKPLQAGASSLRLHDPITGNSTLRWQWGSGATTSVADLGDPRATTDYSLCLYDSSGSTPALVWQRSLAPGGLCSAKKSCWARTARGFRFRSPDGRQAGVTSLRLNSGTAGTASITLRAATANLALPSLPLQQNPEVVFQLANESSCWEARYSTNTRNLATEFRARSDP